MRLTRAPILRASFALIKLGGALACVLPWVLCVTSRPFPGRVPATLVFFLIASEKVWSSLLRMPEKVAVTPNTDWTAVVVAVTYLGVIFSVLADFHVRALGFPSAPAFGLGALLYGSGLGLKWTALRRLGASWSIQLDQGRVIPAALVRGGPYRFIRHPIYVGAVLDALGLALLFASTWGLVVAVVAYGPAMIFRARFEERFLRVELGPTYEAYLRDVPGFVPRVNRDAPLVRDRRRT